MNLTIENNLRDTLADINAGLEDSARKMVATPEVWRVWHSETAVALARRHTAASMVLKVVSNGGSLEALRAKHTQCLIDTGSPVHLEILQLIDRLS